MESEDEFREHVPVDAKKPNLESSHQEEYEIEYDAGDTLNGSHEDGNTIQSERFLKMSHISAKKSNSTNSNIQDCQDLVNGLENGNSSLNIDETRKFGFLEGIKSENQDLQNNKDMNFTPSFDLNPKSQGVQKEEITIIKSKIIPENSSQLKIWEWKINSGELDPKEVSENKIPVNMCTGMSDETTQITRVKSESQQSNSSQVGKMSDINIATNYCFFHDAENTQDIKVDSSHKQQNSEAHIQVNETVKQNNKKALLNSEKKDKKIDKRFVVQEQEVQNFFFSNRKTIESEAKGETVSGKNLELGGEIKHKKNENANIGQK
jgi:hypothetical protein